MAMNWDFGTRSGDLTISNFDKGHIDGGLTVSGQMTTPGELDGKNKFSGELSGPKSAQQPLGPVRISRGALS